MNVGDAQFCVPPDNRGPDKVSLDTTTHDLVSGGPKETVRHWSSSIRRSVRAPAMETIGSHGTLGTASKSETAVMKAAKPACQ